MLANGYLGIPSKRKRLYGLAMASQAYWGLQGLPLSVSGRGETWRNRGLRLRASLASLS